MRCYIMLQISHTERDKWTVDLIGDGDSCEGVSTIIALTSSYLRVCSRERLYNSTCIKSKLKFVWVIVPVYI